MVGTNRKISFLNSNYENNLENIKEKLSFVKETKII